ncbi:MAG: Do family serine endopeptidase [Wenzhouxiangellaceae bacterium]|nr:Do family serine endopeptidase [Wenzhouxiangellaceae bacterium]
MKLRITAWILLAALAAPAHAVLPAAVDGQPLPSLAPVLERVTPAVVNVYSATRVQVRTSPFFDDPFFRRFFDMPSVPRERVQRSLGSGVIVDANEGLILTNNHVIDNADDIKITLNDGREFDAEFIGADRDTDLAVIKIDGDELAELPLFDSDRLQVGDFVVAVGNPFGLGQTVTSGIVSALGRAGLRGLEYQNFIQTDASINPGNSGGALVNLRGELVGINTAIFTPSGGNVGIGFAIPASTAEYVMRQLVAFGEVRRGSLGIEVQELSEEMRQAFGVGRRGGVVITGVRPEGAADRAGLKPGDVILSLDRRPIDSVQSLANVESLVSVDRDVQLDYLRDGRERRTEVRTLENLDARISGQRLDARLDGVVLVQVPPRARARGVQGAVIEEIRRGTPAWETGLRPGDLVVAINREPIESLAELRTRFPIEQDRELTLEIRRRGRALLAVLE